MQLKYQKWIDKNINKPLKDKTILITGANSGIGFEVAKYCSYLKMNIIMAVRNIEKGKKAKELIHNDYPNVDIKVMNVDLSDFSSIDYFVNEIKRNNLVIDYVYHNAGIYNIKNKKTAEGFEMMVGTNYVGTYYLNEKLTNYLKTKNNNVHIIFTTSVAAYRTKLDYETFFLSQSTRPIKYYSNSKLMLIHYYKSLINKNTFNITYHLVHPGITYTPLFSKGYSKWFTKLINIFMSIFFHKVQKAALCTLKAINDEVDSYYVPRGIFNVSGYPKRKKLSKRIVKYFEKTVDTTKKLINR